MSQTPISDSPKPFYIAGPCVIENAELCLEVASFVKDRCKQAGVDFYFKASFDKANRTSVDSYRGPGMQKGLNILGQIKSKLNIKVLTDIHHPEQAKPVAEVVDVLQIPAFLCRQTDLLVAAAQTGTIVNIKKGQFLSAEAMQHAVAKIRATSARTAQHSTVWITERGNIFGYQDLIVDMRGLPILSQTTQAPIVFDATHSSQRPSSGPTTQGKREDALILGRAAAAVGVDGFFAEVHPNPDTALSDAPNSLDFKLFEQFLDETLTLSTCQRELRQRS